MIHLYTPFKTRDATLPLQKLEVPPTRSVTLVIRDMDGVAHTTGNDLDPEQHKEIHISTSYINGVPEDRRKAEIRGVLVHEMVHCLQYNAQGTCSGGLIEGIADYVRLKAGCAPPHWKKSWDNAGEDGKSGWDKGYDRTAFFLNWVEERKGQGLIPEMNQWLRRKEKYTEEEFWLDCCGKGVEALWKEYGRDCERKGTP
jgi:hypothetical protein